LTQTGTDGTGPQPAASRRLVQDAASLKSELEQRARALARPPAQDLPASESLHLVTFPLGQEWYGIGITLVREIQPLTKRTWSSVPCTPGFVVGAVNIRGRIYSMIDVARFLGLPARQLAETAHVLLVQGRDWEGKEIDLGILADDVPQAIHLPRADVQPPAATISARAQDYVRGVTPDMLIVLNLERLLSDPGIVVQEEV
jgi:purine-binding chemotaxis protein CheW